MIAAIDDRRDHGDRDRDGDHHDRDHVDLIAGGIPGYKTAEGRATHPQACALQARASSQKGPATAGYSRLQQATAAGYSWSNFNYR
jgi:hypothetical protein